MSSGRDDWLWLSEKGEVTTYINQRGEGKGMVPRWVDTGVTHPGMDDDIGDNREYVQFGRIFGGPAARHDVSYHFLSSLFLICYANSSGFTSTLTGAMILHELMFGRIRDQVEDFKKVE